MPSRSEIDKLPEEIKGELDSRLINNNFSGYEELADWLQSQGYEIHTSQVGRRGLDIKEKIESLKKSTEMAKLLVSEVGDDEGAMNDALIRLLQKQIFDLLSSDIEDIKLGSLARAVADLVRASVSQKKFMEDIRVKTSAAANEVEKMAKSKGLTAEAAEEIKNKVLGITG